jgi:hypothetical protein
VIVTLAVTAETSLRLSVPEGAVDEPDAQLPVIDVSRLPGASIALRRGFAGGDGSSLRALCVTAPSERWAPGVEELVLERATGLLRGALGGELTRLDLGAIDRSGLRFEQRLEGELTRAGATFGVRGKHLLGFAGEAKTAALCSVVCVEPGAAAKGCTARVDEFRAEGVWTSAPPPSLLVRGILFAADQPMVALGALGALALGIVALVLWRRPKPRW